MSEPYPTGFNQYKIGINKGALKEIVEISKKAKTAIPKTANIPIEKLPEKVDLSKYLHFIRHQYGGCWGYSTLAVWDIMNEIVCPYSPNLSFRLWRTLFDLQELSKDLKGVFSPDGRFHESEKPGFLEWGEKPFFKSFGCTSEGTEPTLHGYPPLWPEGGWTREGVNEAYNYRLESEPRKLKEISSDEFIRWLSDFHPIRASGGVHVIAVVGFDRIAKTFLFADSFGDKKHADGFGTFTFQQLDNKEPLWFLGGPIDEALILEKWKEIPPPRPVPAARIAFKHTDRANVHLWLSVEDSPHPRNKIWSHGWDDNSRNLNFTVRLPSEFIWPPSTNNRIVLDLFDAATYSDTGGSLEEFTVAFGGHIFKCSELKEGPIKFKAREYRRFFCP